MFAILFVLDDPEKLDDILDAWYTVGISGATILESTGIQRRRAKRFNIPIRYTFPPIASTEEGNYTLLTIVPDEASVQACLRAVESIVGNLDEPSTGIFTAWPIAVVKGVPPVLRNE